MTPERLAEIKARCDAATAGPWNCIPGDIERDDDDHTTVQIGGAWIDAWFEHGAENDEGVSIILTRDAVFVAHARTDVPELVAEVERLTAALEKYGEHRPLCNAGRTEALCSGRIPVCGCGFDDASKGGAT